MDRKKYKSYSRAIVTAVNDYFDRQERLAADPYLETREKEDAFLDRIIATIEQGVKTSSSTNTVGSLLQFLSSNVAQLPEQNENTDVASLDSALDFTDSF